MPQNRPKRLAGRPGDKFRKVNLDSMYFLLMHLNYRSYSIIHQPVHDVYKMFNSLFFMWITSKTELLNTIFT